MRIANIASKACSELVNADVRAKENVEVDVQAERHVGNTQIVVTVRSNWMQYFLSRTSTLIPMLQDY